MTRKRGGIYYWRRRWPGGRGEAAFSLGTRWFREAEHLAAVADEAFEGAWRGMASTAPHLVEPTPRGGSPMDDPAERARAVAAAVAAVRAELAAALMIRRAARETAERAGIQPNSKEGRSITRMAFRTAAIDPPPLKWSVPRYGFCNGPPVVNSLER